MGSGGGSAGCWLVMVLKLRRLYLCSLRLVLIGVILRLLLQVTVLPSADLNICGSQTLAPVDEEGYFIENNVEVDFARVDEKSERYENVLHKVLKQESRTIVNKNLR